MRFTSIIIPAVLSLAGGSHGWAQDGNGVWVANNEIYRIRGVWVHEACTVMNTQTILNDKRDCSYWTNGSGGRHHGTCAEKPGMVICW